MSLVPDDLRARAEVFATAEGMALHAAVRKSVPTDQGPGTALLWRLKSSKSIDRKIARQSLADEINDFIGFRLIVAHVGHLDAAIAAARGWAKERGLLERRYENYPAQSKPDLYRSVHIDLAFPAKNVVVGQHALGVEIQITTYLQNFHSTISHQLAYHSDQAARATPGLGSALRTISEKLWEVDTETANMFCRPETT